MANKHDNHEEQMEHFIIPFSILRNVAIGLLALTALTVVTARMNLGAFAGIVAFSIAFVKAMLVMAFFMGLKYDARSNRWIFASGFAFLALLFLICALDIWTRVMQLNTL